MLELVAMLGVAQSLVLLLLIILRYRHKKNLPFALIVLTLAVRLGSIPAWNAATLLSHPWMLALVNPLPFLAGPLLWWYAREWTLAEGKQRPRLFGLHFSPYFIEAAGMGLLLLSMQPGQYEVLVARIFAGSPPWWFTGRNILKLLSGIVYTALAVRLVFGIGRAAAGKRFGGRSAADQPPGGERAAAGCMLDTRCRRWLKVVVVAPAGAWLLAGAVACRPELAVQAGPGVASVYTVLAVVILLVIYLVSFQILLMPEALSSRRSEPPGRHTHGLDPEELSFIAESVRHSLQAGLYRDPELHVESLATKLRVHPNKLSLVINDAFGRSFPALVNEFRLGHFVAEVRRGKLKHRTILELAFDAGFPSKSTFNRVFREGYGMSPTEFVLRGAALSPTADADRTHLSSAPV